MRTLRNLFIFIMVVICVALLPRTASAASEENKKDGIIEECMVRTFDVTQAQKENGMITYIPKDTKLSIIAEKDENFIVEYNEEILLISNDDVLINIADYIPSIIICLDMAQPENLFNMGGEKINGLYDNRLYTLEGSKNGTEAWIKYTPAKKLLQAQRNFREDGYSIVLYDAYRPYSITLQIRECFSKYLKTKSESFKNEWFGELGESWFLAQKASSHNYGVAVDITLVNIADGTNVKMPSQMHTLDKTSAYYTWKERTSEESLNAAYLKETMENVGFTYLKSEWWHFQDNTIPRNKVIDIPN